LYVAYKDKVEFFLVYIREARPVEKASDGRTAPRPAGPEIAPPRTQDERVIAATACLKGLKLSLPVLVDTMEGTAEKAYAGWPAGTAVIDPDGKIAFYSRGPNGAKPKEAEEVLKQLLAAAPKPAPAEPPKTRPAPPDPSRPAR
jgi:hypothetical protein